MSDLTEQEREALAASVENGSHYEDDRGLFAVVARIRDEAVAAARNEGWGLGFKHATEVREAAQRDLVERTEAVLGDLSDLFELLSDGMVIPEEPGPTYESGQAFAYRYCAQVVRNRRAALAADPSPSEERRCCDGHGSVACDCGELMDPPSVGGAEEREVDRG